MGGGSGLNSDRVECGQAGPVGPGGAGWLVQFACGWVYVECTPMLSIGVI
jgi:hypothetical protein